MKKVVIASLLLFVLGLFALAQGGSAACPYDGAQASATVQRAPIAMLHPPWSANTATSTGTKTIGPRIPSGNLAAREYSLSGQTGRCYSRVFALLQATGFFITNSQ